MPIYARRPAILIGWTRHPGPRRGAKVVLRALRHPWRSMTATQRADALAGEGWAGKLGCRALVERVRLPLHRQERAGVVRKGRGEGAGGAGGLVDCGVRRATKNPPVGGFLAECCVVTGT